MRLTDAERQKRYREKHPEYIVNYRAANAEFIKEQNAAYRERVGTHEMNKPGTAAYIKYRSSEKYRQSYTNGHLKRKYGINLREYEEMLFSQGGVCKICKQKCEWKKKVRFTSLFVDHDHSTGKVRGLLCHKCNLGISYLREDETILKSAIKYLKENSLGND